MCARRHERRDLTLKFAQICTLVTAFIAGAILNREVSAGHPTIEEAIAQAHEQLWQKHVDSHGVILDYAGDLPTPEDCTLGKPNAIGWWSPIENGPMFTGLYLAAACERARRTKSEEDAAQARRLSQGLLKCASVSNVPGFIARGMGTDGVCHYPLSSDDQTHPWFYGLHVYFKSDLPSPAERKMIAAKFAEVAAALESTNWQVPCDGAFRGQFRGGFKGHLFRDAARYLYLLRATYDVTKDRIWLDRYQRALAEIPLHSDRTRAQICALGYPADREAIAHLDEAQLWIYVGSQASLGQLVCMESDDFLLANFRAGLEINARNALHLIAAYKLFDNNDMKIFGNADWRAGYPNWIPQPTQAAAQKLAETGDRSKLGERKSYEVRFMRNPLAAAAILAISGDDSHREAIEAAIRHYDYSKLNMAEFFLAECAYYALPSEE
jgi:hypothetical protein